MECGTAFSDQPSPSHQAAISKKSYPAVPAAMVQQIDKVQGPHTGEEVLHVQKHGKEQGSQQVMPFSDERHRPNENP
jgi:hypothetical protein